MAKIPVLILNGILIVCLLFTASCTISTPVLQEPESRSLEDLRENFALDASRFVNIDGTSVHYVDEGSGPPIVLLHASFMSLRAWDDIAAILSDNFRVVRFDLLLSGLTSPAPVGEETVEHNVRLLDGLIEQLDLDRPAIIGTSSGAIVAFRYAATSPDKLSRLILINSAGMPRTATTNPNRSRAFQDKYRAMKVKPRGYWENGLASNFTEPFTVPESLLELVYQMHRRTGLADEGTRFMRLFESGQAKTYLPQVLAPSLILWGEANRTVMHLEADVMQHWMTSAPSLIKKYPSLGHYAYIEQPAVVADDVKAFLNGALDDQLRITTMLPFKVGL